MFRIGAAVAVAALSAGVQAAAPSIDTATIESVTGLKGTYNKAENVFKVSKPRDDVKISVDRRTMPASMGLTSWAAFTPMGKETMLMGDTVLSEDEVNPAMSAALDAGLEVTALHNHFFFDQPRVYFMHIGGMGDVHKLAAGVKALYDRIAQVRATQATPGSAFEGDIPAPSNVSAEPIEKILGSKAQSEVGTCR
jgi:hypothetical protein